MKHKTFYTTKKCIVVDIKLINIDFKAKIDLTTNILSICFNNRYINSYDI